MVWVVIGHSYQTAGAFMDNFAEMSAQLQASFLALPITNFTLSVDTFFVISGCLTAFNWFRANANVPKRMLLHTALRK
jgi:peptidoglycan/LPS O-acetylase OafA/YrhL